MSTNVPGAPQPEYLGSGGPAAVEEPAAEQPSRRRTGLVIGSVVAVVAALGVGGYGLAQLMSGGESAASAVPADALAYVDLDLDPSASQKIEAFKIARKFPTLREQIGSRDDLRQTIVEELIDSGHCKGLSYADDVEPWIGNRIAVAAVPDAKDVALPMVALQVTDEAQAKKGITAIQQCGEGADGSDDSGGAGTVGISFTGDYAVITEKQQDADRLAKQAEASSLADDPDFSAWTDRAGDPGIVTMYVAKSAADALVDSFQRSMASDIGPMPSSDDMQGLVASGPDDPGFDMDSDPAFQRMMRNERRAERRMLERMRDAAAGFEGAAGVVRFEDGGVEADFATRGLENGVGTGDAAGSLAADLPATTAAALAVSVHEGWLQDYLDGMDGLFGFPGMGLDDDQMWRAAEKETGLRLPEDIETLFGSGFAVSVDSSADLERLAGSDVPVGTPVGVRITGDPDRIVPIIDKLKKVAGPDADAVKVARGDDGVAVSFDADYAAKLLQDGDLGGQGAFRDAVSGTDGSGVVFYLDFDAGNGWAERLADELAGGDPEAKGNIAPLDAFGVNAWTDGDRVQHASLRLTTD